MKSFSTSEIHDSSGNIAIGKKHRLVWVATAADVLKKLDNQQDANSVEDPFAAEKPDVINRNKFKEVKAPEIFNPHFYGTVIDISDVIKQWGMQITEKDFVAYDPKTQHVFLYTDDVRKIDIFEQLFATRGCGEHNNLVITSRGDGEMRLVSRSGQKSWLSSLDPQSKKTRHFEVEPGFPANESIIDLRCNLSEKIDEKTIQSLDTSVTLEAGKYLKISEKTKADGTKEAMEMKVEIMKHQH